MPADALAHAIRRVAEHADLTAEESGAAFEEIMRGDASSAQIAAILTGLRVKGESADEITGAARALRGVMVRIADHDCNSLVDTCGTGGGSLRTFNISTAAALLAAGAGVRIAKHGNRSFTSQSGSADILEVFGVNLMATVPQMEASLRDAGIVFMFAPSMHPAMKHVGPVRRELGIPTIMNVVGPLANPAGVQRQVVGVAERSRLPLLAGALRSLGTAHSLVVNGEPGLDEISPLGTTLVHEVRGNSISEWTIDPEAFGFTNIPAADLDGGSPAQNARVVSEVLSGRGTVGARAAVILNAAAAIYVSGMVAQFSEAVDSARTALSAGKGLSALERMQRALPAAAAE